MGMLDEKALCIEDRRLRILQLLDQSNAFTSNESVLQDALITYGHSVSKDRLRTDIAWLNEQGALTFKETDSLWVVGMTQYGLDAMKGHTWIPGIKKPDATM